MKFLNLLFIFTALFPNVTKAQVQKTYEQFVPPGAIMAFALDACPSGWFLADGSAKSRTTYKRLFGVMGTIHGFTAASDFRVPDYRGRFLRMVDGSAGRDPDKTTRTAMNTGARPGNVVGSVQGSEFASHNHGGGNHSHEFDTYRAHTTTESGLVGRGAATPVQTVSTSQSGTIIVANGGNETRPTNAYVIYCIKY